MATPRMDITSFVGKLLEQDDVDALREGVRVLAQAVMETEVSGQIGAAPYERSTERTAYRNGYRTRRWDTRVGTIELKIPKVTAGAYFPSLLEPRRRAEKALHAVVVEAYVKGVSTRKVDDLVKALGIDGISRSEVSRICKVLDAEVRTFLARPIEAPCPYVWLDATFHKVREAGRVISVATVVAIGVTATGERTVLGAATGPSEDHQFWTSFLRSLVKRGLKGVRLVISDAHEGLRQAIEKILHEATWQRCRVHFMRNVLAKVPKASAEMVAAAIRTIFAQPDPAHVRSQLDEVARMLDAKFPDVAAMLRDAAEDLLAFTGFPLAHWRKIWSTNPLERINGEIKRRTNVVGIFPNDAAIIRLVTAVLVETHDEWAVAERRYLSEESMAKIGQPAVTVEEAPLAITA